ncbi:unnamed protein product [Cuscuta campestris]|uniref:Dof zinc finger protein n=2 Tax=Cuscuta sect. Cleistogrammica TaxID=1824901 RepID=A0A484KUA6_9ASTE|nr:hypothetical protein DM860_013266 [Cuscuta australis]VFQ65696.1 unnamed protein product [Cuscuta campestris]
MSSDSGERRPARTAAQKPSEAESHPCPRCDSINTKFCYYNNYNLSQPRHFCKSCRRYWTRGGTLRNVPVGGGTRRPLSNKRPRSASACSVVSTSGMPPRETGRVGSGSGREVNLNEAVPETRTESFTSLLCGGGGGGGFMSLTGFGLGLGEPNMQGFGFGLGLADWAADPVDGQVNGGGSTVNSVPVTSSTCNAWQIGGGLVDGNLGDGGDYFGWPELSISAPGRRS